MKYMKVSELTSWHLEIIYQRNPQWIAENRPVWCFNNYHSAMVKLNPGWMIKHRQRYMGFNHPEMMIKHNLDWMLKHRLSWMKKHYPEIVDGVLSIKVINKGLNEVPPEIMNLINIPIW